MQKKSVLEKKNKNAQLNTTQQTRTNTAIRILTPLTTLGQEMKNSVFQQS